MNYRHAYHAGNFADCFKHALLLALLDSLGRKPTPYFVLDTHAGAGWYDLDAEPGRRTSEADLGIRRLLHARSPELVRYLGLVKELGLYPGSPALIRAVMRSTDRLACCELHPEDAFALKRRCRDDRRIEMHRRSGWEAIGGLLPPKEGRGLVFIDPPFEAGDEFERLCEGLRRGHRRFGAGVFAAWYPIKHLAAVRTFYTGLKDSGIRGIVAAELHLRNAMAFDNLNACGFVVINPPYQFSDKALAIANALSQELGDQSSDSRADVVLLAHE